MPFATNEDVRLHWKLEGEAEKPTLILLHSIGTDMGLWAGVLPSLLSSFQVLRIDARGHGASDAPGGDYTLAMLADDVVCVMDAARVPSAAVAGVSLGGMVAMELALSAPRHVTALALICTSATMDAQIWAERIVQVRQARTGAIADLAMGRFFSPSFVRLNPTVAQSVRRGLIEMADAGYAGCGCAIRDMALVDRLAGLDVPTLIVAGDLDASTPFLGHGDRLAAAIPDAKVVHLEVAHLAPLEAPEALADALAQFLSPLALGTSREAPP